MKYLLTLFFACWFSAEAQTTEQSYTDSTAIRVLKGTLFLPESRQKKTPLVIMIAGSGPTDRDGNSPQLKSDYLKLLAADFLKNEIASFRYDKRFSGKSTVSDKREESLVFEDFSNDAADWIRKFKSDKRFSKIIVLGHSEGSLVGMLAAETANADGFISLAGAGRPIDEILKEQLNANPYNPEQLLNDAAIILDSLKAGYAVKKVNPMLASIFRPSVQPYMISWMRYDPAEVIHNLPMPVMIVQGTTDIQVSTKDAERLKQARPDGVYSLIQGMNHVLRDAPEDRIGNIAVYSQFDKPLSAALLPELVEFILSVK